MSRLPSLALPHGSQPSPGRRLSLLLIHRAPLAPSRAPAPAPSITTDSTSGHTTSVGVDEDGLILVGGGNFQRHLLQEDQLALSPS